MCWNVSLCVFLQRIPKWIVDCTVTFSSPEDLWRFADYNPSRQTWEGSFFLFVWIPGFPIPVESSGSADVPLTMTMLSLWPWHHSRLWIINRGPDSSAGGLFVGKQGVISLSRQAGLMACHKYIKKGKCSDILWPAFWPSCTALNSHLGASLFFPPTFEKVVFVEVLWKFLFWPHDSGTTNGSIHSSPAFSFIEGTGRELFWRLPASPPVSTASSHTVRTGRGRENTTSLTPEQLKVWSFRSRRTTHRPVRALLLYDYSSPITNAVH